MKPTAENKKLSILFWLLTMVPLLIVIATEANKTILIGYLRIVDFIDLSIMAPFYLVITLAIHSLIFSGKLASKTAWISLILISVFVYGHSMHMTANSINTYSTEIRNYKEIIPGDTYALIYFLDEQLGHWLLYLGIFGVLGVWTWAYGIENNQLTSLLVCGLFFGLSYGIVLIESSQAWLAPVLVIWLLGVSIFTALKRNLSFFFLFKINPISQFTIMTVVGILSSMSIYYVVTGGFVEPSKFGL